MLSRLSKCTGLILKHREQESDCNYGSGAHRGQNRYLETTVKDIETLGLWAPQYIFWNFRAQLCPSATPLTSFLSQEGKGVVSEYHLPAFGRGVCPIWTAVGERMAPFVSWENAGRWGWPAPARWAKLDGVELCGGERSGLGKGVYSFGRD